MKIIYVKSLLLLFIFTLSSCAFTEWRNEDGIEVLRVSDRCKPRNVDYWLVDIAVKNSKDSILVNTSRFANKLELNKSIMDTTSSFYKVLCKTCVGDSVKMKLTAEEFYGKVGGSVPSYLNAGEVIELALKNHDELTNIQYFAHKKAFELQQMDAYIKQYNWNGIKDKASGIYHEYLIGSFDSTRAIKQSKLSYTISSTNGSVISKTKEGEPFKFNADDPNVLVGIQFLAKRLKKGDRARALLSSDEAYGPKGIPGKVAGYMPIILEMECIEEME